MKRDKSASRLVRQLYALLFPGALLAFLILFCLRLSGATAELAKPRLEVYKSQRELRLYDGAKLIKTYRVALGTNPVPPKEREGDRATPEGSYIICLKNPESLFHLSLGISYPGPADAERGLRDGLITKEEYRAVLQAAAKGVTPPWNTKLGGEVFVHGHGSTPDWTWGCIALDDADIEELYHLVPAKTPITIYP